MTREQLALEIIERLKKEYPDAGCRIPEGRKGIWHDKRKTGVGSE